MSEENLALVYEKTREFQSGVKESTDGFKPVLTELPISVVDIIRAIKEKEAYAQALKQEAITFEKRAKHLETDAETLRTYLFETQNPGHYGVYSLSKGKTSSVEIECLEKIPADFTRTVVSPDKKALKEALQAGEKIEGCHLETKDYLIIR